MHCDGACDSEFERFGWAKFHSLTLGGQRGPVVAEQGPRILRKQRLTEFIPVWGGRWVCLAQVRLLQHL